MTQQPEGDAVGGADEPIIAAEPTIAERFAAISEEQPEEEAETPQDAQAAPEDADELPEVDPEDLEAEEAPPIQAPVSWTAEEKEEFASLPRNMQETIARRESERDKGVQTKLQEAKQVELKVQQQALEKLQQTQDEYTRSLQMLLPEVPEKPSHLLQVQDPMAYAQAMEMHESAILVRNYIAQELQKANQTSVTEQQALKQHVAQLGQQMLQEKFPEYLDPEKGPELRKTLQSTARALGYSDDQLANTDAQDVLAMKQVSEWKAKADKLDTLMAKQMQRVRDGKKPPAITRPGAPQGKGAVENKRYAADRQAMRSGDRDAATRVFSRFVNP